MQTNAIPLEEDPLAEEEQESANQEAGSSAQSKMAAIAESPEQSHDPSHDSAGSKLSGAQTETRGDTQLSNQEIRASLGLSNKTYKSNGNARTGMVRPKSGKILVRKNTPALLPRVEKLYGRLI